MHRREFNKTIGAAVIGASLAPQARALESNALSPQQIAPMPREAGGIRLPDSAIANQATELAREASAPTLFNHAVRTYLFGGLIGKSQAMKFDEELLYLACILHDLGLTARFMGEEPFEIQGALAASDFLRKHGLSAERAAVVWDGIAFHPHALAEYRQPEVALVSAGAATDVVGGDLSSLPKSATNEVLLAFPRLDFKAAFVKTCADVVQRYPRGASRSFMRDIGERCVPGFHTGNICDAIQRSPFSE